MALTPTAVEVRLGKSDTKTSQKLTIPGTLEVAQNVVMTETGRYDRRAGTSLLTTLSGTRNIHDHGNETLFGTPTALYSRYGSADNSRGSLISFDTRYSPTNNTAFEQVGHDMVITNGQEWSVWFDGRLDIRYSVKDIATGAYVVSDGVIVSSNVARCPRIFAVGTNILIVWIRADDVPGSVSSLRCKKIAVAAPSSVGASTTIDANLVPNGSLIKDTHAGFDGAVTSSSTIVFAYVAASGGSVTDERVRLQSWDVSSMTAGTTLTEAADRGPGSGGVSIIHSTGGFWVAHSQTAPTYLVRLLIAASDLSSFTTTASLSSYGGVSPGGEPRAVTGYVDGSSTAHVYVQLGYFGIDYYTRTSGGSVTRVGVFYNVGLASRPFESSSTKYLLVTHWGDIPADDSTALNPPTSYFIMNATTGLMVGRAISQIAEAHQPFRNGTGRTLPVVQTTSTGFAVAAGYSVQTTKIGAAVVYMDPSTKARWLESAKVTVVPGSWPRIYDGLGVTELGFEFAPDIATHDATTGSAGVATGTYNYKLTWYWVDATGNEHESPATAAHEVTVNSGPHAVKIYAYCLTATLKRSPNQGAVLRAWRTEAGGGDTAAFFLAGTAQNTALGTGTYANCVELTDTTTDSVLITQQRLYTLGDTVLENTATSPCTAMAAWGSRVWSWDGNFLVFSKLLEENKGIAHNDTNFIAVNDSFGDGTALADGGTRLLAFKQGAIYSITGSGPDNTGVGEFAPVDRLELPLGAGSQLSVVVTEIGVFFQDYATSQIWLLGGDAGAEYIGAPVEDVVAGLTVVDAVQVGRQVRFYTSNGTTLVYDLHHKLWTWFTGQAAVAAGVINGVAHYVTSGGAIRYDDATVWTEAGTTYQAALETGWLSFAGLAGYQRTYRIIALGESNGAHTLSIKPTYKFGNATETESLATTALVAAHGYQIQARPHLSYQQSTSLKVRLEDNSPSTAGWGLEALVLEVGIDRKAARLPSAHRAS